MNDRIFFVRGGEGNEVYGSGFHRCIITNLFVDAKRQVTLEFLKEMCHFNIQTLLKR